MQWMHDRGGFEQVRFATSHLIGSIKLASALTPIKQIRAHSQLGLKTWPLSACPSKRSELGWRKPICSKLGWSSSVLFPIFEHYFIYSLTYLPVVLAKLFPYHTSV